MTNPNQSPRDALASAVRAHQAARDALAPLHKRATEAQDAEAERIGLEAEWREFVAEDGLREAPDVTTRERLKGSLLSARRRADGHAAALEAYHGGVAAIEATAQGQRHAVAAVLRAEVERLEGEWRELAAEGAKIHAQVQALRREWGLAIGDQGLINGAAGYRIPMATILATDSDPGAVNRASSAFEAEIDAAVKRASGIGARLLEDPYAKLEGEP